MSSYTQWIPFRMACQLHCLQQGTLNIGTKAQNIAHLLALAITNAQAGTPAGTWARWRVGFGPSAIAAAIGGSAGSTTTGAGLLIKPASVPGFVKPIAS